MCLTVSEFRKIGRLLPDLNHLTPIFPTPLISTEIVTSGASFAKLATLEISPKETITDMFETHGMSSLHPWKSLDKLCL